MNRNADRESAHVLRKRFWELPDEALVDRDTVGAALYLSRDSMEGFAIKGGGPPYVRVGRRALYRKRDVLAWIESADFQANTADGKC